jgi:citrate lyase subunit beta/citryl-CoA lyase
MNNKKEYVMRSLMFVPAHNERLLNSAARSDADVLLLDIEDSVQPVENKQFARNNIIQYIADCKFQDKMIVPRVNDRESGHLLRDLYQLTVNGIFGFMYPKAKSGKDIYFLGKLLETIEYEKRMPVGTFKIIALIETTGAVMNIQDICTACPERLIAVAFGCEDFVTDLGGKHDENGDSIFVPRTMIAMGAKTHNVIPIDTVHVKVHDLEDLEKNLIVAKNLGFEGMLVLNPKEIPLVHKYFSPSDEEIEWAKEMIALFEEAAKLNKGVNVKNDKFIGPPMVKMAQEILKKDSLIRSIKSSPC